MQAEKAGGKQVGACAGARQSRFAAMPPQPPLTAAATADKNCFPAAPLPPGPSGDTQQRHARTLKGQGLAGRTVAGRATRAIAGLLVSCRLVPNALRRAATAVQKGVRASVSAGFGECPPSCKQRSLLLKSALPFPSIFTTKQTSRATSSTVQNNRDLTHALPGILEVHGQVQHLYAAALCCRLRHRLVLHSHTNRHSLLLLLFLAVFLLLLLPPWWLNTASCSRPAAAVLSFLRQRRRP